MTVNIYGSFKPYPNQIDTHKYITDLGFNYNGQIIVIKSSRQLYGKTQFAIGELLRHCLSKPNADCCFIAPTYNQCLENFKKIIYSGAMRFIKQSDMTGLNILFDNGSRIRMFSASQGDSLRGATIKDLLIVDEAAFIKDEMWYKIISPIAIKHKPLIIFTSTPYFKSGFFYDYYSNTDPNANIKVFDWIKDYPDNIKDSEDVLRVLQANMPYNLFKTEYLGEWLELTDCSLFNIEDNLIDRASLSETKYIGIDFGSGKGKDYSVVVGFDANLNQTILWYNNEYNPDDAIKYIIELVKPHKCVVNAESNSIGNVYIAQMRKAGINVKPFVTSNSSKRRIIENMIVKFNKGEIKLLNNNEVIKQFSNYEAQKTANGSITYNARIGFHDDIVMATAIAINGLSNEYNLSFL